MCAEFHPHKPSTSIRLRERRTNLRTGRTDINTKALEKLMEKAEKSDIDNLTGLLLRDKFNNVAQVALEMSRNSNLPFSLIILDVDFFKKYNDTYGHQNGDKVLKFVAGEILKHSRKGDPVGRFGGEEFFVALPGASKADAFNVAERLRADIEDRAPEKFKDMQPLPGNEFQDLNKGVTVSIGVAGINPGESLIHLIDKTDAAMYESKNTGRNKVTVIVE